MLRILIVDDQLANRLAFTALLEGIYAVTTAENGPQALELAQREHYAVILLDVRMPGMDGFEVSRILRNKDRTRYTPIIFHTAYNRTPVQLQRGYAAGATDFIFSPVDENVLKLKIATYAQIYVRNEEIRTRIDRAETALQELREASQKQNSPPNRLERDVRLLEESIDELRKEMKGAAPGRK